MPDEVQWLFGLDMTEQEAEIALLAKDIHGGGHLRGQKNISAPLQLHFDVSNLTVYFSTSTHKD